MDDQKMLSFFWGGGDMEIFFILEVILLAVKKLPQKKRRQDSIYNSADSTINACPYSLELQKAHHGFQINS
jgi:hypothetical protein